MEFVRRCALAFTFAALAAPTLACESGPDLFRLPNESDKEARERFEQTHADLWVIRNYEREAANLKGASIVYLARVVASEPWSMGKRGVPWVVVEPLQGIKGHRPTKRLTLTTIDPGGGSCTEAGDGAAPFATVGTLVFVFEGLPKSADYRPNGIDSLRATSVRTFELLEVLRKLGTNLPDA